MFSLRTIIVIIGALLAVEVLSVILHILGAGMGLIWHHPFLIMLVVGLVLWNRAPWIFGNTRDMIRSAAKRSLTAIQCEQETRRMQQRAFPIGDKLKIGSTTFQRSVKQDSPTLRQQQPRG